MANPIHTFKRKLTNLSSANPYLCLRRLRADVFLDLAEIEKTTLQPAWNLVNAIFEDKKNIPLCPVVNPGDGEETRLSLRINQLLRHQKLTIQERGSNELQLAFPFVLGRWPDGSWVKTPLLLLSASLSKDNKNWLLKVEKDEIMFHPAFLLAYAFHFKQPLEEAFFEKPLNIESADGTEFLTELYQRLKESGLDIHFNQELFSSRISPFAELLKNEPPQGFQPGMLKLQPEAVLGLFPQSDSILIPDFQFLEDQAVSLDSIFLKNLGKETADEPKEKDILPVLPLDGSQEACLREIKKGKSLLVKGPPGTGKSQLIANLMADAMGEGKTVLLVCQKKVALEVVLRRLTECGLGDFVGLWADYRGDKTDLYRQLASQIDWIDRRKLEDSNLNTVVMERRFFQICQQLDQIVDKLEDWKSTLYDQNPVGISVYELYKMAPHRVSFEGPVPDFTQWKLAEWTDWKEWFRQNWSELKLVYGIESPIQSKSNWNGLQAKEIENQWDEISNQLNAILDQMKSLGFEAAKGQSPDFLEWVGPYEKLQSELGRLKSCSFGYIFEAQPSTWLEKDFLANWFSKAKHILKEINTLPDWPRDWNPDENEVESTIKFISCLSYSNTNQHIIKILSFFNGRYKQLLRLARLFQIQDSPGEKTKQILENALQILTDYKAINPNFSSQLSPEFLQLAKREMEDLLQEEKHLESFLKTLRMLEDKRAAQNSWDIWLKEAATISEGNKDWKNLENQWRWFFPKSKGPNFDMPQMELLRHFLNTNAGDINKIDLSLHQLPENEQILALSIAGEKWLEGKSKAEIIQELDAAWAMAWIEKLENENPVLSQVGNELWEEDLQILRSHITEKQKTAREILSLKIREKTYKNLEFNRLGNRVSYRDLYHQVTKKRQRQSLRQLWEKHGDEIKRLVPAWLATPESVSATWPMTESFDLVIFDEASQCFAERSLPAAFRGRQLVIVGDDQQLPPHHLFSARWEEESEDDLYTGQDSLLDLGRQFLPMMMLRQHYRSHFPELIAFSNQQFYEGLLQSIPQKESLFRNSGAIRYLKLEGTWQYQRNETEANEIAEILIGIFRSNPEESHGVITFNAAQQDLIERTIEKRFSQNGHLVPDSLFVKNIENVQGDERDHIWFSIGYGPGENGKVNAQFGSLGIPGGENRLNVAITRSRKSMTIVSSIFPDELLVSEHSPKGPRLLKSFLKYAYEISKSGDTGNFRPLENQLSLADDICFEKNQKATLKFLDGSRRMEEDRMKNYFGYNFMNLSEKGYEIRYIFERNQWQKTSI